VGNLVDDSDALRCCFSKCLDFSALEV